MSLLADSKASHVVNAPIEQVDLAAWLFSLTDETYKACSTAHIAGGTSRTADGRRMSINVERISGNLLVQHYIEDVAEPHHVRVTSHSDSFTSGGDTKLDITWELTVRRLSADSCEFTNRVMVAATPEFTDALARAGITNLDDVRSRMAASTGDHNREETPLFARDIETKALKASW